MNWETSLLEDKNDPILENNKIEAYIEQIKENKFFAGVVEIYIAAKIFQFNHCSLWATKI